MPIPLAAALGAAAIGAEAGGGIITNIANKREGQRNRDWQERMSNTAHQREVEDLKKAGLNPILSVSKGGPGASTPSAVLPKYENPMAGTTNSALTYLINQAEIDKLKSDKNLSDKLANKAEEEANTQASVRDLNNALQGKNVQDVLESKQRIRNLERELEHIDSQINSIDEQIKASRLSRDREKLKLEKDQLINRGTKAAENLRQFYGDAVKKGARAYGGYVRKTHETFFVKPYRWLKGVTFDKFKK